MSRPSNWPLPPESVRYLVPKALYKELSNNPLSCDLFPKAMGYYCHAKGHMMERLIHDDYLMIYCIQGEGVVSASGHSSSVKMGDVLIVPSGLSHRYTSSLASPWTIYWVHFEGALVKKFCSNTQVERSPGGFYLKNIGSHPQLTGSFDALLSCRYSAHDLTVHIFSASLLRQILSHVAFLKPPEQLRRQRESLDLDSLHTLMQTHLHEQIDLDTLAASVNLSKYHFVKRYRAITGTTPINRFIQLKIERACYLLDTTAMEIKEIAFEVGYEDAYYFSRIFRKQIGISPSQYRKALT
ncbi:Arabinose operon regulatory protein [Marinobacterium sp. xm-d-579]|nr:Arabinose operon regulatory protein [Marinobacterium sp. xm-d-579]